MNVLIATPDITSKDLHVLPPVPLDLMLIQLKEPVTLVTPLVLPVLDLETQLVLLVTPPPTCMPVNVLHHVPLDTMEVLTQILVNIVNLHVQLVQDHYQLIVIHVIIVTCMITNVYLYAQTVTSKTQLLGLVTYV